MSLPKPIYGAKFPKKDALRLKNIYLLAKKAKYCDGMTSI